jgi:hypothetical protein
MRTSFIVEDAESERTRTNLIQWRDRELFWILAIRHTKGALKRCQRQSSVDVCECRLKYFNEKLAEHRQMRFGKRID